MIGKVDLHDGLYLLHIPHNTTVIKATTLICKSSHETWHQRMGHPSSPRFISMKSLLNLDSSFHTHEHCRICPLAKQMRLSFQSNNHVASHPFDLVHCDI